MATQYVQKIGEQPITLEEAGVQAGFAAPTLQQAANLGFFPVSAPTSGAYKGVIKLDGTTNANVSIIPKQNILADVKPEVSASGMTNMTGLGDRTGVDLSATTANLAGQQAQEFGNARLANEGYINAAFRELHKRDANIQELASFRGKGIADVFNAIQAGAPKTPTLVTPTTPTGAETPTIPTTPAKTAPKTAFEQIQDIYTGLTSKITKIKETAAKGAEVEAASAAITTAKTLVNNLRTQLANQGILDYKALEVLGDKPILNSMIRGQQAELSREQKLDMMIGQNNYNNSLVSLQIAQGNYDRAREIVKETANDYLENVRYQIEALKIQGQIEETEANKIEAEAEKERKLAFDGYTYISNPEDLASIAQNLGITRENESQYILRLGDKIYLKPQKPDELLSVAEAKSLGVSYGTTKEQAAQKGIIPTTKTTGAQYKLSTANKGKLLAIGFTNSQITQLSSDVNEYGIDAALEGMPDNTKKLVKAIFSGIKEEEEEEELDDQTVKIIVSGAVDKDGNLDINKIPANQRIEVIKRAQEMGLFEEEDEETSGWLSKFMSRSKDSLKYLLGL